jgi:hypothetical protein
LHHQLQMLHQGGRIAPAPHPRARTLCLFSGEKLRGCIIIS